ncbi:formimidoylglutamase [Fusibacter ferrireducens]|uniref:Formimidoylglutamase n=1 Tax=Fusibacter ferrireducens TaxID=2785058 RepID=A0ABR9ZQJ7_9FIRM|nr:formimidoylglutamase [Fusibacter ferrireducens]MBF4692735.1 formimidoylglutamase [Fusibacter ferrireducens]
MKNYTKPDMSKWTGRIDHTENYDAFRWHQWIQSLDLNNTLEPCNAFEVGIAFIGFCSDEGVRRNLGRTGAAKGPNSVRKELCNMPCSFAPTLKLFDAGDVHCIEGDLETAQNDLALAISQIMSLGLFPLILGGGHEVALGTYKGIALLNHFDAQNALGIINFDAHFDIRPYEMQGSSGTMFRQISDLCVLNHTPFNYFCIGIQKRGNTVDLFKTADKLGIQYLMAKDIGEGDLASAFDRLDQFIESKKHLYVTICTDVFSSAFAPGVSASQPLGLHPERLLKFFKYIFKSKKVIAFDIAEVSPRFDHDNITANLAATFIFSAVNAIAHNHNIAL